MSSQSAKQRKAKLKHHNGSTYDKEFDGHSHIEMPNEDNKILKYSHREKSLKVRFIIYADLECLLEKMHSYQNSLERSDLVENTEKLPYCHYYYYYYYYYYV